VDLKISKAAVHLGAAAGAQLEMSVTNAGPVTEHLAVALMDGHPATLTGAATMNPLSTAGVVIPAGATGAFGVPHGPAIVLTNGTALKAGGTATVMLQFGIAGLIKLDVPILSS
jgi:hypothetical protein